MPSLTPPPPLSRTQPLLKAAAAGKSIPFLEVPPCPAGTHQSVERQRRACTQCPKGSYSASHGQVACTAASALSVGGPFADKRFFAGFHVPEEGASEQAACPPGTEARVQGLEKCTPWFVSARSERFGALPSQAFWIHTHALLPPPPSLAVRLMPLSFFTQRLTPLGTLLASLYTRAVGRPPPLPSMKLLPLPLPPLPMQPLLPPPLQR